MVTACKVAASNLEVASVEVALMKRYFSVYRYLFGGAAAHVVVAALNGGVRLRVGEAHGAVFGIVWLPSASNVGVKSPTAVY